MFSMRDFLKSSGRRLSTGWVWPLVLLALPGCILPAYEASHSFDPGPEPKSSAIMCDIPKVPPPGSSQCASPVEQLAGISLTNAAVALATGQSSAFALDFSADAISECGGPRKIEFYGPYPDGSTVCLNCMTQIPAVYADANAACVAQCEDLIYFGEGPKPDNIAAFCEANARVSTNFEKNTCYDKACSNLGTPFPFPAFIDPRRTPEPVKWVEQNGTQDTGNSLERTAPTTGGATSDFNAGAASAQVIQKGDGWIEFEASELDKSHVVGVSESCPDVSTCPDNDYSLKDIRFSISLNNDGLMYVLEQENVVPGPATNGSWGVYVEGERFRVHFTDNHDGTATISYGRLVGPCTPGTGCAEDPIPAPVSFNPAYPLRVDASFREEKATISNVTIVRIQ